MHHECSQCLFCEEVEDEVYMTCQAKQKLVMGTNKICDFFEKKEPICEEDAMPIRHENTTELDDSCCGANSDLKSNSFGYSEYEICNCDICQNMLDANNTPLDFMVDDLEEATTEVLESLVFLGEGTTPRDVMGPILGLEATISLLKRFLLEYEEPC